MRVDPSNMDQLAYWDGASGAYWARRADRFEEGVADYDFVGAVGVERTDRVLDVGCGSGATTRAAARLAVDGHVLGVDLSGPMLALARERSTGLPNVGYEQADAQVHPFPEHDVVMSRSGVMFFGDPESAFTNLARALRPGGRLALMTWQAVSANEWQQVIRGALRAGAAPAASGFADPDWTRNLLTSTGFTDIRVEPRVADMYLGATVEDALDFVTGQFAQAIARLDNPDEAAESLRVDLAKHQSPTGVRLGSAAWFIHATR
ncbi:class I SAM-dependent methyltransferase [Actinophytocola sp. NPDC049390]|uniref:class I SAM-dependent methyltransferase n=1 Tax=Actinophytocola sp. NPDC049390 TaxID=3363894 RepID=UPI00379D4424